MNKKTIALMAIPAIAAIMIVSSFAPMAEAAKLEKITICHQTGSESNPEVVISVNRNVMEGHIQHGDYPAHQHPDGTADCRSDHDRER